MKKSVEVKLLRFERSYDVHGKGPLSVVLVITREAKSKTPPYKEKDFLTAEGGQVAGLGRSAVQGVLKEYGISRVLAEEGGRTSRGSIKRMTGYVRLLNELSRMDLLDLDAIEAWWIKKVQRYFSSQPLKIKLDQSKSLAVLIKELIDLAYKRQRAQKGTTIAGAVMQHLVGAKLSLVLPKAAVSHKGYSVADQQRGERGDFMIGDTAVHVTAAPTEALIRKCELNLSEGVRPIIITTEQGVGGARALSENLSIRDRVDIFEISQFVSMNIYELSEFVQARRPTKIRDLIEAYNRIITSVERDPSLRIEVG